VKNGLKTLGVALISMVFLVRAQEFALSADLEVRDESAYIGKGVVEWRVILRNNGTRRICCQVDLTGPIFRFGQSETLSDRRRICVYPGRENYASLPGVTTHIGTTGTWSEGTVSEGAVERFSGVVSEGRHGATSFRVENCDM
jgi:hypothetical protein